MNACQSQMVPSGHKEEYGTLSLQGWVLSAGRYVPALAVGHPFRGLNASSLWCGADND